MHKYHALETYLSGFAGDIWAATFSDIEVVLGFPLPPSASKHRAWWANSSGHQHSAAWLNAGFLAQDNLAAETVTFSREPITEHRLLWRTREKSIARQQEVISDPAHVWDEGGVSICHVGMDWVVLGRVVLDTTGRLRFPPVEGAGMYRLRIRLEDRESVYFGESNKLPRRFGNYRTGNVGQKTSHRIHHILIEALARGAEVSVAVVLKSAWIEGSVGRFPADLTSKAVRVLLEHASIAMVSNGADILNLAIGGE